MKVRAIETSEYNGITAGNIYEVIDSNEIMYEIANDDCIHVRVYTERFEVVEDKEEKDKKDNPFNVQVGGSYYKKLKIQPMEYAYHNKLDMCQASVVKYVTRFRDKNGKQDLEKAKHIIDMLIAFEYGENGNGN